MHIGNRWRIHIHEGISEEIPLTVAWRDARQRDKSCPGLMEPDGEKLHQGTQNGM